MIQIRKFLSVLAIIGFLSIGFGATYYLIPTIQSNNAGSATFLSDPVEVINNYSTNTINEVYTNYSTNYIYLTNIVVQNIVVDVYVTNSVNTPIILEAENGTILSPFVKSATYISQPGETTFANGGRAFYTFNILTTGNYLVVLTVNAPSDAANSLFINIDSQPTDPATIFDIPITTSFQERIVNWRGNGSYNASQFIPKVFNLIAGTHTLNIRGREGNTQIDKIKIISQ